MRKLILMAIIAAGLTTSACNTMAGVGQDVEAAGEAVEETARDVQN